MSAPAPEPEIVILIDSEAVFEAVVRAVKSVQPSVWTKVKRRIFRGADTDTTGKAACVTQEIAANGTGFTRSRRFRVNGQIVNFLLIKPEDGQLFGWLTLAEFHERVSIKRVLCIAQSLSLREDLHSGDVALVTQASALPYPALYASRAPEWQEENDRPSAAQHYFLSDDNLRLGRDIAGHALENVSQSYIPEVHTGYARHPAWGGGMMPWAAEQFDALTADGLETISELAVGVFDFATRLPSVPVVCYNIVTGRAREMSVREFAVEGKRAKDLQRYALYSPQAKRSMMAIVSAFMKES